MKKIAIYIVIILVSTSSVFAGGPWPQQKGKGFFKLSEWWIVFDEHYTDSGKTDPNVTTGIFNTFVYAEYGITDRFTGIVNGALFSRNYMNNIVSATTNEIKTAGDAVNSVGDFDIGLKYGLTSPGSKIPIAATLTLGLPIGKIGAGEQENLQTGDGEFNQMLQIDAGTSFSLSSNIPSYATVFAGYNNRTNDYSDEYRFGLEYGVGLFSQKLWIISRLSIIESAKNSDLDGAVTSTSIFANNTEFTSLGFEANYYLTKNIGVSASYATALRGEIIAAAPSYSFGFFYDMSK